MKKFKRGRRKKDVQFKPSHKQLEQAIEEFLNNGGKIIRVDKLNYKGFVELGNTGTEGDDFLMGV